MHYVYLIQCGDTSFYKIGISANPVERLVNLQAANPLTLTLIMTCGVGSKIEAMEVETQTHQKLSKYSVHYEWFKLPKIVATQLKKDMLIAAL